MFGGVVLEHFREQGRMAEIQASAATEHELRELLQARVQQLVDRDWTHMEIILRSQGGWTEQQLKESKDWYYRNEGLPK